MKRLTVYFIQNKPSRYNGSLDSMIIKIFMQLISEDFAGRKTVGIQGFAGEAFVPERVDLRFNVGLQPGRYKKKISWGPICAFTPVGFDSPSCVMSQNEKQFSLTGVSLGSNSSSVK